MNFDKKYSFLLIIPLSVVCYYIITSYYMGGTSSKTMSAPVVVNATAKHTATVIFLHGLGDTGHGWSQGFQMMRQPHIKYICPTANAIPVSLNGGFVMPSWFDIKGLSPGSDEDEAGIKSASQLLQSLIKAEVDSGINRKRVIIGGFSQGGALALYSALAEAKPPVGGIIALSSWLPLHKQFPGILKSNQDTPILQCHGEADPLVRFDFGRLTASAIGMFNQNHMFKSYPNMQHSSSQEEMEDVKKFIDKILPPV